MSLRFTRAVSRGLFSVSAPAVAAVSAAAAAPRPVVAAPLAMAMPRVCFSSSSSAAAPADAPAAPARAAPKGFSRVGTASGRVSAAGAAAAAAATAAAAAPTKPLLSAVMRSLWTKVHPDLFTNYPEQLATNEQSLAMLQGFLSALKDTSSASFPNLHNEKTRFYFRTATPGHFRLVQLSLHVPGGKSKDLVAKQLGAFFAEVGLAPEFSWDKEYFPLKAPPRADGPSEAEQAAAAEAERREQHASGDFGNESYEQFQERIKAEAGAGGAGEHSTAKEDESRFKGFYGKYDKKKKK